MRKIFQQEANCRRVPQLSLGKEETLQSIAE